LWGKQSVVHPWLCFQLFNHGSTRLGSAMEPVRSLIGRSSDGNAKAGQALSHGWISISISVHSLAPTPYDQSNSKRRATKRDPTRISSFTAGFRNRDRAGYPCRTSSASDRKPVSLSIDDSCSCPTEAQRLHRFMPQGSDEIDS
jgi:hypothetical protein